MRITNNNIPRVNEPRTNAKGNVDKKTKIDSNFDEILKTKLSAESKVETKSTEKTAVKEPVSGAGNDVTTNAAKQSAHMKEVNNIVKNTSDVRTDKVEEIKAKIAAGTYNVSSEDLADKLINSGFVENLLKSL
ncbi:MAG: flagellar biosynthesis anti-sigma factor FlgM [Candidatus Wallbacteria bacterium]